MKIFYDIPYMKDIMQYVLIPIVMVIIVVGVALFIYSKKVEDHESPRYNFVMNFWSSLIGIVITGAILAIAVGFSFAMTEKMREYNLIEEKKMLYYLLKYFIIIPFIFVLWYIVKFLKTIYYKPKKEKQVAAPPLENAIVDNTSQEKAQEILPAEEKKEKVEAPLHSDLPPMEETIQKEMKQFDAKNTVDVSPSNSKEEEVEVISLEDE